MKSTNYESEIWGSHSATVKMFSASWCRVCSLVGGYRRFASMFPVKGGVAVTVTLKHFQPATRLNCVTTQNTATQSVNILLCFIIDEPRLSSVAWVAPSHSSLWPVACYLSQWSAISPIQNPKLVFQSKEGTSKQECWPLHLGLVLLGGHLGRMLVFNISMLELLGVHTIIHGEIYWKAPRSRLGSWIKMDSRDVGCGDGRCTQKWLVSSGVLWH
jgi:hypothetical protein